MYFVKLVSLCYCIKDFSPSPKASSSLISLATFELASMVCRNMCIRLSSKIIVGESHYSNGKKYCRRCEHYFITEKVFCECCGMQLRTTPMISTYKRILRERLGTVDQKAADRTVSVSKRLRCDKSSIIVDGGHRYEQTQDV